MVVVILLEQDEFSSLFMMDYTLFSQKSRVQLSIQKRRRVAPAFQIDHSTRKIQNRFIKRAA